MAEMKLYKKLLEVRKSVDYLQKSAEGQQYKYTSSSQVLSAVRAKMNELGLLLVTTIDEHNLIQYENSKGVMVNLTELELSMEWIDVEDGDKLSIPWYGQGVDLAGEKGVGKALTYAEKYFILKQFNIPTDKDDPDAFQEKNASAEDLKAAQEERKKQLIASIGKCTKLEQVTKIWQGNPDLKKDKEFAAAVKKKGEALKVAEEKAAKDAEPKDQSEDEQPK
jgi:hypothetical protein